MISVIDNIKILCERFWNSKYYVPFFVLIAACGLATDRILECMFLLAAILVIYLLFCDDMMPWLCPVFYILVLSVKYFKDYSVLTDYMWYAIIPIALALIFNTIKYWKPIKTGKFLLPLVAVTISLFIGGLGYITTEEYLKGAALYHVIGLGLVSIIFYLYCTVRLENERDYDRVERFAAVLYGVGILAFMIIANLYISNFQKFLDKGNVLYFKPRNYVTSVLLLCMPMTCLFIKRNNLHLVSMFLMYGAMLLSGSRSGLLFGSVELVICLVYIYITNKKSRKLYNCLLIIAAIPVAFAVVKILPALFASRMVDGSLISADETRVKYFKIATEAFLKRPVFGIGLGTNENIEVFKAKTPGCILYYHNFILQIFASLGLAGAAAYSWNGVERIKLMFKVRKSKMFIFIISYAGIMMMSLTNPGIFCPFPEAQLLVIMFALMEKESKSII